MSQKASPRTFTLYNYVRPENGQYAKSAACRRRYGSASAYVDHLIAQDRQRAQGPLNQLLVKAAKTVASCLHQLV